jgi:hypothetical protein
VPSKHKVAGSSPAGGTCAAIGQHAQPVDHLARSLVYRKPNPPLEAQIPGRPRLASSVGRVCDPFGELLFSSEPGCLTTGALAG